MLNNAIQIRLWLSRGQVDLRKRPYEVPYSLLPLEGSVSALKLSSFPKVMLYFAVLLYTIGFGLYLLYSWLHSVESGRADFRNIFIAFTITVGLVYLYQRILDIFRDTASSKRDRDFDVDKLSSFAKPASRQQLEEWLVALQSMQNADIKNEADYIDLKKIITDLKTKWETAREINSREEKSGKPKPFDKSMRIQTHITNKDMRLQTRKGEIQAV